MGFDAHAPQTIAFKVRPFFAGWASTIHLELMSQRRIHSIYPDWKRNPSHNVCDLVLKLPLLSLLICQWAFAYFAEISLDVASDFALAV